MWKAIMRAIVPAVLVLGGIASLIYGVGYHSAPVSEEREVEIPIAPPAPFAEPMPGEPPLEGFPGELGFVDPGPPMDLPPFLIENESELTLIRETTIGGVTLLACGVLKRTYSGEPPSLCPT
jgi:hypothetical protein